MYDGETHDERVLTIVYYYSTFGNKCQYHKKPITAFFDYFPFFVTNKQNTVIGSSSFCGAFTRLQARSYGSAKIYGINKF